MLVQPEKEKSEKWTTQILLDLMGYYNEYQRVYFTVECGTI